MAEIGMHVGHVMGAESVHETHRVGVAAQYPRQLAGGEDREGVGEGDEGRGRWG